MNADSLPNNVNNIFFRSVNNRFKSFKTKIKRLSHQSKIVFDEDIFMDTIIRCYETFSNCQATDDDIDNYFWKAYKLNLYSSFSKSSNVSEISIEECDSPFNIIGDEYNSEIDEIVSLIKEEVKEKFGYKIFDSWILHICNGYTYEDLENEGYSDLNLHNEFKKIKRYILNNFIKKNNKIKNLLIENNLIS